MTISHDEITMESLAARLAESEHAHQQMRVELAALQVSQSTVAELNVVHSNKKASSGGFCLSATEKPSNESRKRSRRGLFRRGLETALAAIGAGALLGIGTGTSLASSNSQQCGSGSYCGSGGTPAVTGIGTKGSPGVTASSDSNTGVNAYSGSGWGVYATSKSGNGVVALVNGASKPSSGSFGVYGASTSTTGVVGLSAGASGPVSGSYGVYGVSNSSTGTGVYGGNSNGGVAVYGNNNNGAGYAGFFNGSVAVTGKLSKGGGSFKIDHPQDPSHKYLSHSFVESPDMKNIYDGVVTLDAQGQAEVRLPSWFDVLNSDFRYQLTCLGGYAPVYIAEEISSNRFKIAGGQAGMKVFWLVTGIRQDAWANAHRIPVEEDKPIEEQGFYLHPDLYGESEQKSISSIRHP